MAGSLRCKLANPPFDAHVLSLVAPPTTTPVALELAADAEQAQLDAARLVLRHVDGDDTLVPVLQRISSGAGHATLRVPVGTWLFDVVPRGALEIVTARELVRVGHEPLSLTVRIRGNSRRIALELRGLLRSDFPVRVRPFDTDAVAGVDGELEFLGPFHWQRPIESIAPPDRRVDLLVLGRNAQWLSATPIDGQGERAVVDLVPGRRLDFLWIDGPPRRDRTCRWPSRASPLP